MPDSITVHFVDHAAIPVNDLLHLAKVGVEDGRDLGCPARA